MPMALGRKNLDDAGNEIENLFKNVSKSKETIFGKIGVLPSLLKLGGFLPITGQKKRYLSAANTSCTRS